MSSNAVKIVIQADGKEAIHAADKVSKKFLALDKTLAQNQTTMAAITKQAGSMKTAVVSLVAAWQVKRLASGFITAAKAAESFDVQLTHLLGSPEKAKKAFQWIEKFATETPYQLDEIISSYIKLKQYGFIPEQILQLLGDTASATGRTLSDAVEMYSDAVVGEMVRAKEMLGIVSRKQGDTIKLTWQKNGKDIVRTVKNNRAELEAVLKERMASNAGLMKKESATMNGIVSNLVDHWESFERRVMQTGPFEIMKDQLSNFLAFIDKANKDGSIEKYAKNTSVSILKTMKSVSVGVESVYNIYSFVKDNEDIYQYGIVGLMLFGKTGAAIGGSIGLVSSLSDEISDAIEIAQMGKIEYSSILKNIYSVDGLKELTAPYKNELTKRRKEQNDKMLSMYKGWGINEGLDEGLEKDKDKDIKAKNEDKEVNFFLNFRTNIDDMLAKIRDLKEIKKELEKPPSPPPPPPPTTTPTYLSPEQLKARIAEWNKLNGEAYKKEQAQLNKEVAEMDKAQYFYNAVMLHEQEQMKKNTEDTVQAFDNTVSGLLDKQEMIQSFAGGIRNTLGTELYNGLKGDWSNIESAFANMLLQLSTQYFANIAVQSFFSGIGMGNIFTKQKHDGSDFTYRSINPSVFMGAKRYHNGLAGDEFPAILQKGETVIPRNTNIMPNINVNIKGIPDRPKITRRTKDNNIDIDIIYQSLSGRISSDIMSGGTPIARALETTYSMPRTMMR